MTIGFITPEYPNEKLKKVGGLGTSIKNLVLSLKKKGVASVVFAVNQDFNEVFMDNGVEIHAIKNEKRALLQWYFNKKQINTYISKVVLNKKIDLLEAPDWMGITSLMNFRVPLVIRIHGSDGYFCHLDGRKQKFKNRFFEKNALKNADVVLSVSNFAGKLTNQVFNLNREIKTIHNGLDITAFSPLNVNVNGGQVLYFGTIVRKKGVLELAPIFSAVIAKYPEASFLLIGNDNPDIFEKKSTYSMFYELLSDEAKQKTKHIKAVPYEEVKKHIAQANVIVLPSFAEAFPMTWLETLAMEKALVSSDIGWAKELMVDQKTGFTVNPKNHKLYADKIVDLLENPNLCKEFGKSGRQRITNHFSTDVITNQNIEFYKETIS